MLLLFRNLENGLVLPKRQTSPPAGGQTRWDVECPGLVRVPPPKFPENETLHDHGTNSSCKGPLLVAVKTHLDGSLVRPLQPQSSPFVHVASVPSDKHVNWQRASPRSCPQTARPWRDCIDFPARLASLACRVQQSTEYWGLESPLGPPATPRRRASSRFPWLLDTNMWPARSCPFHLECQTILAPCHAALGHSVLGTRPPLRRCPTTQVRGTPVPGFPKGVNQSGGRRKKGDRRHILHT